MTQKNVITYEELDPIEHILRRPDMYIGNQGMETSDDWIVQQNPLTVDMTTSLRVVFKSGMTYSDGLLRIFQEPLSNMIDNAWRSQSTCTKCTRFKIGVNADNGMIKCWNDGLSIEVRVHESTPTIYIPEMIFGRIHTSSNYNDDEQRFTSGRNGIGIKLTNVFSKTFSIECMDPERQCLYQQTWTNHMKEKTTPKIVKKKSMKKGYTSIQFVPDYDFFRTTHHILEPGQDFLHLFLRHVVEMSMFTQVPVELNYIWKDTTYTHTFPKMSMEQWIVPFFHTHSSQQKVISWRVQHPSNQMEFHIIWTPSPSVGKYVEMTYVNGISTKNGGLHIDQFVHECLKTLVQKFTKSGDAHTMTIRDVKPLFGVFVQSKIPNPSFDSQSKHRCVTPSPRWNEMNIHVVGKKKNMVMTWEETLSLWISDVMKWPHIIEFKKQWMAQREFQLLQKQNSKRVKKVHIDGYDVANFAGTKKSSQCTLILCEGLSAKTFAIQGIKVGWNQCQGRDYFGIYPFRGKCLNVRNASLKSITNNREWTDLIQCLNLKHGLDYRDPVNFAQLSYGKVMLLTDADTDGIHIASLITNFFHVVFPSLLQRGQFLWWMRTPIAKVYESPSTTLTFYSEHEYQQFLTTTTKPIKTKYFKGLGTCSNEEILSSFGTQVVELVFDDDAAKTLEHCFSQQCISFRKSWVQQYSSNTHHDPSSRYPISLFLNQELIRFSIEDCRRSIPHLMDGLKWSQRKILYAILKKPVLYQDSPIKVAQLAGYVAEITNYHHGEQCLYDTICKMAQVFVGANFANLPLLHPEGQFGSRVYLGKDAANGRYIFTKGVKYLRSLFPKEDDELLTRTMDDGDWVEPEMYSPIVPLILINGCPTGIGTGWSCTIPPFHPLHICQALETYLTTGQWSMTWIPYYHGFRGTIRQHSNSTFLCQGNLVLIDKTKNMWRIDEIPIGQSMNKYKEFLEQLEIEKCIDRLKNESEPSLPLFTFRALSPFVPTLDTMKLTESLHLSNLVLFNVQNQIQKYESLDDIMMEYISCRLQLYEKRRQHRIHEYTRQLRLLTNKIKWVQWLLQDRHLHQYFRFMTKDNQDVHPLFLKAGVQHHHGESLEYILDIPIRHMTQRRLDLWQKEHNDIQHFLTHIQSTSAKDLWRQELIQFRTLFLTPFEK